MPSFGLAGASLSEVWQDTAPTDRRAPGKVGSRRSRGKKLPHGSDRNIGTGKSARNAATASSLTPSYLCQQGDAGEDGALCDLYHQNFNSSFDDIMDVYQRDEEYRMSHKRDKEASGRKFRAGVVETQKSDAHMSDSDSDSDEGDHDSDSDDVESDKKPPVISDTTKVRAVPKHIEDIAPKASILASAGDPSWPDLALYVLSGVLLIFMLETFVKLGAGMRTARFNFS